MMMMYDDLTVMTHKILVYFALKEPSHFFLNKRNNWFKQKEKLGGVKVLFWHHAGS